MTKVASTREQKKERVRIRLDALIVSKRKSVPSKGYFRGKSSTLAEWERVFGEEGEKWLFCVCPQFRAAAATRGGEGP